MKLFCITRKKYKKRTSHCIWRKFQALILGKCVDGDLVKVITLLLQWCNKLLAVDIWGGRTLIFYVLWLLWCLWILAALCSSFLTISWLTFVAWEVKHSVEIGEPSLTTSMIGETWNRYCNYLILCGHFDCAFVSAANSYACLAEVASDRTISLWRH